MTFPNFHINMIYLFVLISFYLGVNFGDYAFNKLTGIQNILLNQHLQFQDYTSSRSKFLSEFDTFIANKIYQKSIEESKTSTNEKFGILENSNIYKNVVIPMAYRRSIQDVEKYYNYAKWKDDNDDKNVDNQTKVLILTYYRSGSSFFGQIFNQHEDIFYNFEPLFPYGRDCTSNINLKIKTLQNLLKCDYKNSQKWSEKYKQENLHSDMSKLQANDRLCLFHNACFRSNSKSFCDKSLCIQSDQPPNIPCEMCGPLNLEKASFECRQKPVHVIKVIRICSLNWLKNLIKPTQNLKIIHLVRDPRGLAASRDRLHMNDKNFELFANISSECGNQVENFGEKFLNDAEIGNFIRKNLLEIRYEDLTSEPYNMAKIVLNFINLNLTSNVEKWINSHGGQNEHLPDNKPDLTNLNSIDNDYKSMNKPLGSRTNTEILANLLKNKDKIRQKRQISIRKDNNLVPNSKNYILPKKKQPAHGFYKNPYSTLRKSSSITASSWRKFLPLESARKIEKLENCSEMMSIYGYLNLPDGIGDEKYSDIDYKVDFF